MPEGDVSLKLFMILPNPAVYTGVWRRADYARPTIENGLVKAGLKPPRGPRGVGPARKLYCAVHIRASAPSRGFILDHFAGSGPTLIPAERTSRACLAVELEPRCCDMILTRWEALNGDMAVRPES